MLFFTGVLFRRTSGDTAVVLFRRADLGGVEKMEEEVRGGMDFGA